MIIADTHVHFYPCYRLTDAFRAAFKNLNALIKTASLKHEYAGASRVIKAIILTERFNSNYFGALQTEETQNAIKPYRVVPPQRPEEPVFKIVDGTGDELLVIAGRQIVTAERLELLALGTNSPIPDGLPWPEALQAVLSCAALPVLCWSPGKWLFKRAEVVKNIISCANPKSLLIGDTALRPKFTARPALMRRAQRMGFCLVAGSDPLPFEHEELRIGSYATFIKAGFEAADSWPSLKQAFFNGSALAGRRLAPWTVLNKLFINWNKKKHD